MKSQIINIIIFFYLSIICFSLDYQTIPIYFYNDDFVIQIKLSETGNEFLCKLSNIAPINVFPSINCSICESRMNESDTSKYTFIKENVSSQYYYFNYFGDKYNGTITASNSKAKENFIAFKNLTYTKKYRGNGMFSLSYLNYNFETEKKLFALKFVNGFELHVGGYDDTKEGVSEKITFDVTVDENGSNETEYKSLWYINFLEIYINDVSVGNGTNNLRVLKEENNLIEDQNYKLTFDIGVHGLRIPRNFFMENLKKIFPEDGKCQINRNGYFICDCNEDYKTKFANFKFVTSDNKTFYINTTDYMHYFSSISGSKCNVYLWINYDNDLFIGGRSVINNYYDVFDIQNKTFSIFIDEDNKESDTVTFIILFAVIFSLSMFIFFGGYYFYNKNVINNPNNNIYPVPDNQNGQ